MSTKDSVLEALIKREGSFTSGEELSGALDISRTAVWKAISSLREEGYTIKAITNKGYMLIREENTITEESIRAFLSQQYKGNRILLYDTLDSTNAKAKQIALEKPEHGTVIIAHQQSQGRGRLGRSFFSPRRGIYLSIVIKPSYDLSKSVLVTAAAAVAVAEAIEDVCGQEAQIKWVNDIFIDGKKVCGILTEGMTDFETGSIETMIVGIGINTSTEGFPDELKKTAGAVEGDYSRAQLAAGIISRVLDLTKNPENRSFMPVYKKKSLVIGKTVSVFKGGFDAFTGNRTEGRAARVLDIDNDGGLMVLYSDGSRETLSTGEISIRL